MYIIIDNTLRFRMTKWYPYIFGDLALTFGIFFLFYGINGGFIDKKILSVHPSTYVTGMEAVARGIFYVFLGVFFLAGFLILLISIVKK
jgi:hypothetical protein